LDCCGRRFHSSQASADAQASISRLLAGGFQQLGLSPGMIGRFLPIVLNFFQQRGGQQTRNILEHALA
jgi:hypothetical protein